MNEKKWIKSLDRDAPAPVVDVAAGVLREIRVRQAQADDVNFAWPALFATIAGSAAAVAVLQVATTLSDPLSGFLDAFKLVLQ